ncbi:uncharacterized protein BYT42DRAFT_551650 [Radiomyces spectabilis]|uniref:uncharacterized protein n=1 Tax=Radiomyces spectabilis TaxID=64574 RepID=UPI00221EE725|nr:uncharacterized protein BYT42DRAFT_551650 [Radiomyces spectabilis]KAI8393610.1 hypothetical protein BYT42DRAFT_551650 [Radiomyces spectabilis]
MNQPSSGIRRNPCIECREHKRRCSYDQPCQRCIKYEVECRYIQLPSPADQEYLQQIRLLQDVETLEDSLATIEKELNRIQMQSNRRHEHKKRRQSIDTPSRRSTNPVIAQSGRYAASLVHTKDTKPWTLTVNDGHLSISTSIATHADLLANLQHMITTLAFQDHVPMPFQRYTEPDPILSILRLLVWQHYGKSRFKILVRGIHLSSLHRGTVDKSVMPTDSLVSLTTKLLRTYTSCLHLQHVAIHIPTFINTILRKHASILHSPALMALCAAICSLNCRHVAALIPTVHLAVYSEYYFQQAHELLQDTFDDPSIETFAAYIFMSFYKVQTAQIRDSILYAEMAERVSHLLRAQRTTNTSSSADGLIVLQQRLFRFLLYSKTIAHLAASNSGNPGYTSSPDMVYYHFHETKDILGVHEGDTMEEARHLQLYKYMHHLQRSVDAFMRNGDFDDKDTFFGTFSHQLEMIIRHWYSSLPPSFRLSLPLFQKIGDDRGFFELLERECSSNPLPILSTIKVYSEYLVMAKSKLPKQPNETGEQAAMLQYFENDDDEFDPSVIRGSPRGSGDTRLKHIRYCQEYIQFDGTDEEFIEACISAFRIGVSNIDQTALDVAIDTAIQVIRLLRFMRMKPYACFFDYRAAVIAWGILLRALRYNGQQPFRDGVTADRILANLILCLKLMRDEVSLMPHILSLRHAADRMEKQLNDCTDNHNNNKRSTSDSGDSGMTCFL